MADIPLSVLGKLGDIEARLAKLESHLDLAITAKPSPEPEAVTPPVAQKATPDESAQAYPDELDPTHADSAPVIAPQTPVRTDPSRTAAREAVAPQERRTFEQLLGGRVFAIAGALIVVLAVTFFVKLAYDNGWLSMPPLARIITAWAFGLGLLGAAEVAYRRISAAAAIGLNIAGLATLYIASFVALALYDLVSVPLTFVLLASTAMLGLTLSIRARNVAVAALSLGSAYAVPFLLHTYAQGNVIVPYYCIGLLVIGLSVASSRRIDFGSLRGVLWGMHLPVVGLWALTRTDDASAHILASALLTWGITSADLWRMARRIDQSEGTSEEALSRGTIGFFPLNALFLSALWTFLYAFLAVRELLPDSTWVLPAGMGAAALCASLATSRPLPLIRRGAACVLDQMATAALCISAAFGLVAIALGTSGWLSVTCWLGLAVSAAIAARALDAPKLLRFTFVNLAIGLAHTLALTPWEPTLDTPHNEFGGLFLTRGTLAIALNALACFAVSVVHRSPRTFAIAVWFSCVLLGVSVLNTRSDATWIMGVWYAIALLVGIAQRFTREHRLATVALALLVFTIPAWLRLHVMGEPWQASGAAIAAHPGFVASLFIVALAWGLASWHARRTLSEEQRAITVHTPVVAGVLFLLLTSSLEVVRAAEVIAQSEQLQRAVLSIWWAFFALPLLLVGFVRRVEAARVGALVLIGVAATKALVYDLFLVEAALRIVIFLAIGLLMIGIAIVYARLQARSRAPGLPDDGAEPEPDGE